MPPNGIDGAAALADAVIKKSPSRTKVALRVWLAVMLLNV